VIAVETGHYYSMALKGDGTVWMWGQNNDGQLGDGTKTNRSKPVKVSVLANVIDIGNGRLDSLAIESELGDGTKTNRGVPTRLPGPSGAFGLGGGVNYSVVLHT
jgi:alpha-tubulin suppressor-like RCC1 family protein